MAAPAQIREKARRMALLNGSMRCVALAHDVTSTIRRGKNVYAMLMGSSVLDSSLPSSYVVRGSFIQVSRPWGRSARGRVSIIFPPPAQ